LNEHGAEKQYLATSRKSRRFRIYRGKIIILGEYTGIHLI